MWFRQSNTAGRMAVFTGLALVAGMVGYLGRRTQVLDATWYADVAKAFAWNEGWDCGDSGFVSLHLGESRCSFRFEGGGRVFFDSGLIGSALLIPAEGGTSVSPSKLTVHLTTSPDGRCAS